MTNSVVPLAPQQQVQLHYLQARHVATSLLTPNDWRWLQTCNYDWLDPVLWVSPATLPRLIHQMLTAIFPVVKPAAADNFAAGYGVYHLQAHTRLLWVAPLDGDQQLILFGDAEHPEPAALKVARRLNQVCAPWNPQRPRLVTTQP